MVNYPNESKAYRSARQALLEAEIALRAQIEAVAEQRRALPAGGTVPEDYAFADPSGRSVRLSTLFGDFDHLLVYSYMYGPDWAAPCPSCTSMLDGLNGQVTHITAAAALAVVASARPEQLARTRDMRGWTRLPLYSAGGSSYQTDYHGRRGGKELPMLNVFERTGGEIRHFWGSEMMFAPAPQEPRHVDALWPLWNALDLTRAGRGGLDPADTFAR
ncbi:MAG: DUF899 family protein [Pseudomonadota bacterium]